MARGGGGGAGKVDMQDFHFTMRVNKASPTLMLNCASGKHIPKATLVCRKAGGNQEEFLKLNFSDILISSYQTGGSNGADVPMDQISLNFAKVEYEYMTQDAKGKTGSPVKVGWDLSKNVKV
jgi:type VI secretion system secreted protein Hcp